MFSTEPTLVWSTSTESNLCWRLSTCHKNCIKLSCLRIFVRAVCAHITRLCGSISDMNLLQKIDATSLKRKGRLMIFLYVQCVCVVYCLCSTHVCKSAFDWAAYCCASLKDLAMFTCLYQSTWVKKILLFGPALSPYSRCFHQAES